MLIRRGCEARVRLRWRLPRGDTAAEGHSIVDAMTNSSGARLRATTPLLTGTVTSTSHAWDRHPGMVQNRRDLGVDRLEST